MFTSRDIIDTLLARGRKRLRSRDQDVVTAPGEFPPGWQAWFASLRERVGAVTGASAEAIVAIFLQRELALPPARSMELGRWQAFGVLWRQQWHASGSEPAQDRIAALTITMIIHLLLVMLLLWLAYMRFVGPPALPGEDVIQIEYIGRGAPEDTGGGVPQLQVESEPQRPQQTAARPQAAAAAAAAQRTALPAPKPEPAPLQPSATTPAPQPLEVSQTATSDSDFVLPPTTTPELQAERPPIQQRPALAVVEREIEVKPNPTVPQIRPQVAIRPEPAAPVTRVQTEMEMSAIPLLARAQDLPEAVLDPATTAQLQAPVQAVRHREIPLKPPSKPAPGAQPTPPPATDQAATASSATTPPDTAPTPGAAVPSGTPAAVAGSGEQATDTLGRGPIAGAPPGGIHTRQRGDDWGESDRNRPGGNTGGGGGLYNPDGSPRLPPGAAATGGGFPPGSDNWSRDQLDRYGTWSRRPLLGYEPTHFDQYWIPSGSLLQEWVRRGIKSLAIPIPGTTKKINCTISILQLGGGCGVSDLNLQDQEATARPPPDMPYKPELQESQP